MISLQNVTKTYKNGVVALEAVSIEIEKGEFDPSFVISHRVPIDRAPEMYKIFRDKKENCTKVVLDPWADGARAA